MRVLVASVLSFIVLIQINPFDCKIIVPIVALQVLAGLNFKF